MRDARWLGRGSLALACALTLPAPAVAQFTEPPAPAAYALSGVTVVYADGRQATDQTVLVRGDFIEAIGPGASVPGDAQLLEGDSLYVYPGLVDANGTVKFEFVQDSIDRSTVESWNPPRQLQGFMPSRRVVDALEATGEDGAAQRKKGIVAVAVHPSNALMAGQGTLLLLRRDAERPAELVLDPALGASLSFRGGRGTYPGTLFGAIAWLRQTFMDTQRRGQLIQAANRDPRGITRPSFDPDYMAVQQILAGESDVYFAANDVEDIRRVLRLADEFGFRPVIVGGAEAWLIADELEARGVPVLVSLDFPKPRRWKPDAKPDSAATEPPAPAAAREQRELEAVYANAGRLIRAGVQVALTSGEGRADLREGARKVIEYGLGEADALRALTTTPAALLGAPNLVRVEAGFPANLVVSDGPLFEEDTRIVYTFVEGALEKGAAPGARGNAVAADGAAGAAAAVAGTWQIELNMGGETRTGTMRLSAEGDTFTGTLETPDVGTVSIFGGSLTGDALTFRGTVDADGETITIDFAGTLEGETARGTATGPFGTLDWTATRTSPGGDRP
ncbi:MAG: hypothetical protein ACRELD_04065 [Longimicrobiales bacterium]